MDGQGDVALRQINVIAALIRQLFNLKGAKGGERERLRGREGYRRAEKKKRALVAFRCLGALPSPPPHLLLHPFIGCDELPGYYASGVI